MKFAIIANPRKYAVKEVLTHTIAWAEKNGISLLLHAKTILENGIKDNAIIQKTASDSESIEGADFVIVMGGDGTILYTARISRNSNKPVLGVNSGRLGFMANTQIEDIEYALNCLVNNNFTLDKRPFLKATDKNSQVHYALNEFLFTRKDSTSMVSVTAEYDGSLINTYWSDGLIVASPTGSTAYNLASGGPIASPDTDVFLVTPINPHTLTTRPLVLNSNRPLRVILEPQDNEMLFSYDGHVHEVSSLPFEVVIEKSELTFNLVHLPGQDYFQTLRNKLMWGMDSRKK